MKSWQAFRKYHGSDSFYGCVAPDGTWFDSALLFSGAVHWCVVNATQDFDLSPPEEAEWLDSGNHPGYSVIHSVMLQRMYEKGLIK